MQDVTTGAVKTFVGPCVINQTAQEVPVVYASKDGTFYRCGALEEAVRKSPIAVEGFYLTLKNPAVREGEEHPARGSAGKIAPELQVGRKVNIPGPCMFALWPGQAGQVLRGHHLRSNQYLLVRVYNEEEARANWGKAVVKPAEGAEETDAPIATAVPPDLTVGKLLIIKGTEVSFYIPPTGIGVVPEGRDADGKARYVRDALTLERLEYCILVDEDGRKRYERGPQVVFPQPTETFIQRAEQRKFRAIELNEIQGLHIKVIAPYTDERTGEEYREGDELFITGKETAIYFPREEHSSISYDGKAKHFATAIPAGEARYVMDRITGEIAMHDGPAMLLPDPRRQVIVRRVLTDSQVELWYPGNVEALEYNRHLRALLTSVPTTRQGAISEGDYERGTRKARSKDQRKMQVVAAQSEMERSLSTREQDLVADEFTRASTYTQPRTVTLDTKFQGVPSIDVWTGCAIMVVSKTGTRRVVQGPTTVLLRYDETLEVLELSTGRPKSDDQTIKTVFLRTVANKVTDVVEVETSDHVRVQLTLSHKVNFEDDPARWFDVENYVQFLCDHVRSVLKGAIKKVKIEEFYARSVDIIREVILGAPVEQGERPGMSFAENHMRVADVEVLTVKIYDERIRGLLDQAQHQVVKSNIELSNAQRELEATQQMENIARETARSKQETRMLLMELGDGLKAREAELQMLEVNRGVDLDQATHARQLKGAGQKGLVSAKETETEMAIHAASLKRQQDDQALRVQMIASQTESVVEQARAVSPHLITALERLADEKLLSSLAAGFGEFAAAKGVGLLESARQFFDFLPEDKLRVLRHIGRGYREQSGGDGEKGE
jgi:major vault protein